MKKRIEVGVIGSAVFAPRNPERMSLEESMHAVTKNALRDAGIGIDEIDGIVYFKLGGPIPVNPSGGTLCSNAIAVTAMARVAEAALQVWGRAGAHQVKGAKRGIGTGNGGDHQLFGAMVVEA